MKIKQTKETFCDNLDILNNSVQNIINVANKEFSKLLGILKTVLPHVRYLRMLKAVFPRVRYHYLHLFHSIKIKKCSIEVGKSRIQHLS